MASTSIEVIRRHESKSAWFSGAMDTVRLWLARGREREILAGMDHRMLRDIGLSPADVHREYRKPFWRD